MAPIFLHKRRDHPIAPGHLRASAGTPYSQGLAAASRRAAPRDSTTMTQEDTMQTDINAREIAVFDAARRTSPVVRYEG